MSKRKKSIVTNSPIENKKPHYYSLIVNNLNEYKFNTMEQAHNYTSQLMLDDKASFVIIRKEGQLNDTSRCTNDRS